MEQSPLASDHEANICELVLVQSERKEANKWSSGIRFRSCQRFWFLLDDVKLVRHFLGHKPNYLWFQYHQSVVLTREALFLSGFMIERLMMANTCFSAALDGKNHSCKNLTLRNINLQLNLGY